jgi:hypothetical protein
MASGPNRHGSCAACVQLHQCPLDDRRRASRWKNILIDDEEWLNRGDIAIPVPDGEVAVFKSATIGIFDQFESSGLNTIFDPLGKGGASSPTSRSSTILMPSIMCCGRSGSGAGPPIGGCDCGDGRTGRDSDTQQRMS